MPGAGSIALSMKAMAREVTWPSHYYPTKPFFTGPAEVFVVFYNKVHKKNLGTLAQILKK